MRKAAARNSRRPWPGFWPDWPEISAGDEVPAQLHIPYILYFRDVTFIHKCEEENVTSIRHFTLCMVTLG